MFYVGLGKVYASSSGFRVSLFDLGFRQVSVLRYKS